MMSIEIGLALEFLGARCVPDHGRARVRVFALGIVRVHVRLVVVAALEEFAADVAFVSGFFGSGPLTLLLDAGDAGEDGLHVESRQSTVAVEAGDVPGRVRFGPFARAVQVLGVRGQRGCGLRICGEAVGRQGALKDVLVARGLIPLLLLGFHLWCICVL